MRKKHIFIIVILIIMYASFLFIERKLNQNGQSPTLHAPESTLKVSVKDGEEALLKGVTASDDEDGDLSDQIYIENISSFQSDQKRIVTYAVIDSDDNITRATREIEYTDYQKPELYLTKALCLMYVESNNALKDYVAAKSSVDGDLTSQISVDNTEYNDNDEYYVTYSVMDSCGVKVSLRAKVTILSSENPVDMTLTSYSMRVKKGTTISPKKYIDKIELMGTNYSYLKSSVTISNNYDATKAGTYEFIYHVKVAGETGMTKLVVIVEEDENE